MWKSTRGGLKSSECPDSGHTQFLEGSQRSRGSVRPGYYPRQPPVGPFSKALDRLWSARESLVAARTCPRWGHASQLCAGLGFPCGNRCSQAQCPRRGHALPRGCCTPSRPAGLHCQLTARRCWIDTGWPSSRGAFEAPREVPDEALKRRSACVAPQPRPWLQPPQAGPASPFQKPQGSDSFALLSLDSAYCEPGLVLCDPRGLA